MMSVRVFCRQGFRDLAHYRKDDWCECEYRCIDLLTIASKNSLTQVQLAETNIRIQKYGHLSPGTNMPATWTERLHNILMYLASAAASKITIHRLWNETPFTLFMLHAWLSARKASRISVTICQADEPFAEWQNKKHLNIFSVLNLLYCCL